MAAKRSKKKKTGKIMHFFDSLDEVCKDYGARLLVNEHWIDIEFKDGKYVTYALPFDSKSKLDMSTFKDMIDCIESGFQGRVFSKNGQFIDYAPAAASIDRVLIAVDMMV